MSNYVVDLAIKHNQIKCLIYLIENDCSRDRNHIGLAAYHNNLECVKILHESGVPLDEYVFCTMIDNKNAEAISYLCDMTCPINNDVVISATSYGVELLMYVIGRIDFSAFFSTVDNELFHECKDKCKAECLKYLLDNGFILWHTYISVDLVASERVDCLEMLIANGYSLDPRISCYAANFNTLECLKFLNDNGYPWNAVTAAYASINGRLECLKFLHENGCEMDKWVTYCAAKYGFIDCLTYLHQIVGCELIGPSNYLKYSTYLNCLTPYRQCNQYVLDNGGTFTDCDAYFKDYCMCHVRHVYSHTCSHPEDHPIHRVFARDDDDDDDDDRAHTYADEMDPDDYYY
jgi:hypothetical protein